MRPPDLPGGNLVAVGYETAARCCFNEAAGFTRRKPPPHATQLPRSTACFNEAAGFTRRKPGIFDGQPGLHRGFNEAAGFTRRKRS